MPVHGRKQPDFAQAAFHMPDATVRHHAFGRFQLAEQGCHARYGPQSAVETIDMRFVKLLREPIGRGKTVISLQNVQDVPVKQPWETVAVILLADLQAVCCQHLEHDALGNYFGIDNRAIVVEQDVLERFWHGFKTKKPQRYTAVLQK